MDAPLDLYRARREELIALVLRQGERIAELEQRLGHKRLIWPRCGRPSAGPDDALACC